MVQTKDVKITIDQFSLPGTFFLPPETLKLVIFAHGSGSSRLSSRNLFVAEYLFNKGISSLLFDLLTEEEDLIYENRFDINLITGRLIETTKWVMNQEEFKGSRLGYFGASTGAAAAFKAAKFFSENIKAVVSRGGRPDLVLSDLGKVKASTLLIVGGQDLEVIALNEEAYKALGSIKKIAIIPGATHLFEEPGKLEEAAEEAANWFNDYL